MKTELPVEMQEYHSIQAEIANRQTFLNQLGRSIAEKYCEFKSGDLVRYRKSYDNTLSNGKVAQVYFRGVSSEYINNKWVISVVPLTKTNEKHNRTRHDEILKGRDYIEKQ